MKNSLLSLFSFRRSEKPVPQPNKSQHHRVSVWQDTGLIYYLLNTIKLRVETELGVVSFERVSLPKLQQIINNLKQGNWQYIYPTEVAGQRALINISLCGVTWQELNGNRRVKAIQDAALLRFKLDGNSHSQAIFKLENALDANDVELSSVNTMTSGKYSYVGISLNQFIDQIEMSNDALPAEFKKGLSMNAKNFNSLFTENEYKELAEHCVSLG